MRRPPPSASVAIQERIEVRCWMQRASPTNGGFMTANALLLLKQRGFIERATEARSLGCHGGDHVFGLVDGRIVAVDLALQSIRVQPA
jgi:hypothetical protein